MDLPTCPACGQSVLDDDAAECPFCGSPMKGGAKPAAAAKPAAKAASKAAPAKAPPVAEAKAAPAQPAKAPAAPRLAAKPKSDDPFDFESTTGQAAVAVSPRAVKGKTLEVKCPICETVGFVPPAAAGKDARCCNPDCKLPLFTVPVPKKEEAPPPPPPRSSMPLFIGGSAVLVIGLAVGAYFAFFNTPDAPEPRAPTFPETVSETSTQEPDVPRPTVDEGPKGPTDAQIVAESLTSLISAARESRTLKAYTRRTASVAATIAGDDKRARDQLEQIKSSESNTDDDEIVPLVMIAWKQFEKGDASAGKATLDQAFGKVSSLEKLGRYRSEAALHLATLLASQGRTADAWSTLKAGSAGPLQDSLTVTLEISRANRQFDLDRPQIGRSIGDWEHPQAVGVNRLLCSRGRWKEALEFVKSASDPSVRGESLVIWGETYAAHLLETKQALDPVTALLGELKSGEKSRLLARLASLQQKAGDEAAARQSLAAAVQSLGEIQPIAAPVITNLRELRDVGLPDPYPMRAAALGAGDVALVQSQMKQPDAWATFQKAFDMLSRNAPEPSDASRLRQRCDSLAAIREDLNAREQEARLQQPGLRNKANALIAAAAARRQREMDLYEAAIDAGLLKEVWDNVQKSPALLRSGLATLLVTRASPAQSDLVSAVNAAVAGFRPEDLNFREISQREASRMFLDRGDVQSALNQLPDVKRSNEFDGWRLRLICRAINSRKLDDAMLMLGRLSGDATLQADAVRLASALGTQTGQRQEFLAASRGRLNQPPNQAALHAGVIDALAAPGPKPAVAAATESKTEPGEK